MLAVPIAVEELAQGDRSQAVAARFAATNTRVVGRQAIGFAILWGMVLLANLDQDLARACLAALAGLASGLLARLLRVRSRTASFSAPTFGPSSAGGRSPDPPVPAGRVWSERAATTLVTVFLFTQQVLLIAVAWNTDLLVPVLLLPPMLGLGFQLVAATRIALHASWLGLGLLATLGAVATGGDSSLLGTIPASVFFHLLAVAFGLRRARSHRRGIEQAWEIALGFHGDRLRMQRELETARSVQLGMLPTHAPALEWVDWATLSLPANEVGGDYYDYHVDADGGLVVVVADVAGHGLASGLLLSGLRACLALLEDLTDPEQVLGRLHAMIRRTRHERSFVTLSRVRLSSGGRQLDLAAAGHPPLLIARAESGEVEELGGSSTPLGAMHSLRIARAGAALEPGDALLLITDGVYETLSPAGEPFGFDNLTAAFHDAATGERVAAAIRDAVLRSLWTHKAEARQEDDITMVVMVVREPVGEPPA